MYLTRFDPFSVAPDLLVNREECREWLRQGLTIYLEEGGMEGAPFILTGDKGVGKSIVTRHVLREIRGEYSGDTLVVQVDCRDRGSLRRVLGDVAKGVVSELRSLKDAGAVVPDALLDTARILGTLTRFDEAELKVIHEHLVRYTAALQLSGPKSLLRCLQLNFGISLEVTDTEMLVGRVQLDDDRMVDALVALFEDVREQDLRAIVYLDNLDELRHQYRDAEERERVRRDAVAGLLLRRAPVGFVVNARTYFSGIVPREMSNARQLRNLAAEDLRSILERRVRGMGTRVRAAWAEEGVQQWTARLAEMAPTPMAMLIWFKYLFERHGPALDPDEIGTLLEGYLRVSYAGVPFKALLAVAGCYDDPEAPASREEVLAACGGNEAVFAQLQDRQAILPQDFWHPTEFRLDPELHFLLARGRSG